MDLDGARYSRFQNFWDRPFVSGMIQNFGGRTQLGGALSYSLHPLSVRSKAQSCIGLGAFPEGMANNPVLYDLLYEMAWRDSPPDLSDWTHQYATRRYGRDLPEAVSAWETLRQTAYSNGYIDSMVCARPALKVHLAAPSGAMMRVPYNPIRLWEAWGDLLKCSDQLKSQETYQFDVMDVGRQCLSNLAMLLQQQTADAFASGDREKFHAARDRFLQLAADMDRLAGTRRESLLGAWIADARRWGVTDAEKDQYEWNARMQVSIWGPAKDPAIFDYSWRQWSGLISGYYIPRWRMFFDFLDQKLAAGESYDDAKIKSVYARPAMRANDFYSRLADFEEAWPNQKDAYPSMPTGDSVAIAYELFEKYLPIAKSIPPATKPSVKKD
jgi:alpha-N-acetylglucosaminidase